MTAAPAIDIRRPINNREVGYGTDPLWPAGETPLVVHGKRARLKKVGQHGEGPAELTGTTVSAAANRQHAQLPAFAPLLEELEVAGWSSHRQALSANFHDWKLLRGNRLIVLVGHAANAGSADPIEAALISQAAWAAIRAHAIHSTDAGDLLSLASQTLWAAPAATLASLAIALVDTTGGSISVALAGDCLAWRVRAATCDRLPIHQPMVATAPNFNYQSQALRLALRERIILVAGDSLLRSPKGEVALAARFSNLDAESHRRMAAADAVALAREVYDGCDGNASLPVSIAAIRRR